MWSGLAWCVDSHIGMVPPTVSQTIYAIGVSSRRQIDGHAPQNDPAPRRHRYPQNSLLRSLLDRRLMGLADRGGASGFVGHAWGEFCRGWLLGQVGQSVKMGTDLDGILESVVDIDAIPGLAAFASSRGLQNPDFLLTLRSDDDILLVAADAKFSIETAKPRQVSAEILTALLETPGTPVRALVPLRGAEQDGFFITPDFELTHLVLNGTMGILRTAVTNDQVHLLTTDPGRLFASPQLRALIDALAAIDGASIEWSSDLVAALYYGRCAFACLGCRIDETKPLLGQADVRELDDPAFLAELRRRGQNADSAWQLILHWDRDADEIRATRVRVHQIADIGVANRDLRTLVEREAERLNQPAPSVSRVRRELAIWTNTQLVHRFGIVYSPVPDLADFLVELRGAVAELQPQVPNQVRAIVAATISP
jgi:hypothetical protein